MQLFQDFLCFHQLLRPAPELYELLLHQQADTARAGDCSSGVAGRGVGRRLLERVPFPRQLVKYLCGTVNSSSSKILSSINCSSINN